MTVSLSLGAESSDGHTDLPALLHRADTALYQAKSRGRNQAAAHAPDPVRT